MNHHARETREACAQSTAGAPTASGEPAQSVRGATVLIVDDDQALCLALTRRLRQASLGVRCAATVAQTLELVALGVDAALVSDELPDGDGLALLQRLRDEDSTLPVILLTARSSVETAVAAMRAGAYHYAVKPLSVDEVLVTVQRALETTRLRRKINALRTAGTRELIGEAPAMVKVRALLAKIAFSPASTVLITGESGTGKDLAAQTIHAGSARAASPFLNITCSALPPALLESELFGHERGAFTDAKTSKPGLLETADGGTVFLDEIGELDPAVQTKLLRFLEDKAFRRVGGNTALHADVRIIAATNVDLPRAVAQRIFREDLFYRLAVLTVHLPPLRERGSDIELLTRYFVDHFSREFNKRIVDITPAAGRLLAAHSWPGNVRELRNLAERAVLLAEHPTLDVADFRAVSSQPDDLVALPAAGLSIRDLERSLLEQALRRCGGNQVRAGQLLGLTRDQVRHRIKKFGLSR